MPLTPGTRLGLYEVLSSLGAGGMGEVYRARDVKLGREVAIKIILDVFAADPERIARFEREAKVLAALNHPHIAALYGMESSATRHFLVMELVEGQTLADRLARGSLPVAESLAIAIQIAEALEAAHEKGIVHRDLKPANVKITPDDRVKVLDFGLAKAIENETSAANVANSPTLSMMASQAGIILGTAAYMSPEQAKGFPADHRSDVFSFGSVLYEMLTGRQPFHGDTAPELLASVLVRDPDLSRLPGDLDPRLSTLVRRCLEKHPRRRWQAIGDVRAELEAIAEDPRTQAGPAPVTIPQRPLWKRALPAVIAAVTVGGLAGAAAWRLKPLPQQPVARFSILLPADQRFTTPGRTVLAVSPDGMNLVYLANNQLYLRQLGELEAKPILAGPPASAFTSPVFSPDSRWIAFFSVMDQALRKISVAGGSPVTICPATNPFGMSWGDAGIVYGQSLRDAQGIFRVSANGGTPTLLVKLAANESVYGPQLLPGADVLMFTVAKSVGPDRWDLAQVVAQQVRTGERKVLLEGGSDARYLPTGHLAFARQGSIYVVPFDLRRLAVTGGPVPVIEGVRRAGNATTGLADFSLSTDGLLAYVPGPTTVETGQFTLAFIDRNGTIAALKISGAFQTPRISRDGRRIAFSIDDPKEPAVYVYDVSGTTAMQRLTYGGRSAMPVWSADGNRVTYQSDREGKAGMFWQAADGTGAADRLTTAGEGEAHAPLSWHPGGDLLLFEVAKGTDVSLWTYSRRDGKAAPFGGVHSHLPTGAVFSPDGHWVAYAASEEGAPHLFVQPFPATGAKYELTGRAGAHHPMWSPDGKQIFYVQRPGAFDGVSVTTSPTFAFGNPTAVPRGFQAAPPADQRPYDMAPDGRFVGLLAPGQQASGATPPQEIYVVLNWFEEVKARTAPAR